MANPPLDADILKKMIDAGLMAAPHGVDPAFKYITRNGYPTFKINESESDTSPVALGKMIDMRLRTPPGKFLFQFMQAFKYGEKVVVFIVQKDQPTFLEDDWALFPSDELVTKLRLIVG